MDQILINAINDYRKEFGEDIDPFWNPQNEQDIAEYIQASGVKFKTFRSKNERVWKALMACTNPIIQLSAAAQSAASASGAAPGAGAAIGGLASLVTACQGVSQAYDFIEELFVKVEDVLSRWQLVLKHELGDHLKQKMQQIMVVIFAIVARSRTLIRRSRLKHYFTTLVFGKDEKTQNLVTQLETLLTAEDRARSALSLDTLSALWQKAIESESKQSIERLNSPVHKINSATYSEKKQDLVQNTGSWLRQDPLYKAWMNAENSLLMVLGGPGSGKSSLATSLINELLDTRSTSPSQKSEVDVGYFYVDNNHDLATMLRTMAYQIAQTNAEFRRHAAQALETDDLLTSKTVWYELFQGFWNSDQPESSRNRGVLVIDGLDEAPGEEVDFFAQELVRELVSSPGVTLQVAIFGRPKLRAEFDYIGNARIIQVDSEKNRNDIAAYIEKELRRVRVLRRSTPAERKTYQEKLLECADGVFEWARLLLSRCRNLEKRRILELMDNPPASLDDMIKTCFEEIKADEDIDSSILSHVLTWTAYGKRPLFFGEIYNSLYAETDEHSPLLWFYMITKLSSIFNIRSARIRQSVAEDIDDDSIETLDEDKGWSPEVKESLITLRHSRIRDYVVSRAEDQELSSDDLGNYPPKPQESECQIVKTCLKMLQQSNIDDKDGRLAIEYPVRAFILHLELIKPEEIGVEDRTEIVSGLLWLFSSEDGNKVLFADASSVQRGGADSFWRRWFLTNTRAMTIQQWLQHASESSEFNDSETMEWVESAKSSIKKLYEPLAKTAYKTWLQTSFNDMIIEVMRHHTDVVGFILWFLKAYHTLNDQGEISLELHNWTSANMESILLPPEDVEALANLAGLPRDARWLTGVGVVNLTKRNFHDAISLCEEAFQQDNTNWAAAWCIANASGYHGDIESAIHWADIAKKLNPTDQGRMDARLSGFISATDNWEMGLKLTRAAYEADRQDITVVKAYLDFLSLLDDWVGVLKVFRELQEVTRKKGDLSVLVHLLKDESQAWRYFGEAYWLSTSSKEQLYILETLEAGLLPIKQHGSEHDQISYELGLASWYYHYVDVSPLRTIALAQKLLKRARNTELILNDREKAIIQLVILVDLQQLYFDLALQQYANTTEANTDSSESLQETADTTLKLGPEIRSIGIFEQFHVELPACVYGLWLRCYEKVADEKWKALFRKPILSYLSMLEDSDSLNDVDGLCLGAAVLYMAGEVRAATAFTAVPLLWLFSHARARKNSMSANATRNQTAAEPAHNAAITESNDQRFLSEKLEGTSLSFDQPDGPKFTPDGIQDEAKHMELTMQNKANAFLDCRICRKRVELVQALYMCQICPLRILCDKCVPGAKLNPALGRSCTDKHPKLQIWPVPDDIINEALVNVKGEYSLKEPWLKKLQSSWQHNSTEKELGSSTI